MEGHGQSVSRELGMKQGFKLYTVLLMLAARAVWGQSELVQVQGRVLDPAKATIAGAKITATANGSTVEAVSGPTGEFHLTLAPKTYTIKVAAEGFAD